MSSSANNYKNVINGDCMDEPIANLRIYNSFMKTAIDIRSNNSSRYSDIKTIYKEIDKLIITDGKCRISIIKLIKHSYRIYKDHLAIEMLHEISTGISTLLDKKIYIFEHNRDKFIDDIKSNTNGNINNIIDKYISLGINKIDLEQIYVSFLDENKHNTVGGSGVLYNETKMQDIKEAESKIECDYKQQLNTDNIVSKLTKKLDEFIIDLDIKHLTNNHDVLQLKEILGIKLSDGAQGNVYTTKCDNRYVIKESKCLPPPKKNKDLIQSCSYLTNKTLYNIQRLTNGTTITTSDTISECIIGRILSYSEYYIYGIVPNYGSVWGENNSYAINKMVRVDTTEVIKTSSDLCIFMFQYLHTITVAQQLFRFSHNDSHILNILLNSRPEEVTELGFHSFDGPRQSPSESTYHSFKLKNPGWFVAVNDYGLSRLTYKKNGKSKSFNGVSSAFRLWSNFNHCVDYLTLMGCIIYPGFTGEKYNANFKSNIARIHHVIKTDLVLRDLAYRSGFTDSKYYDEDRPDYLAVHKYLYSLCVNGIDDLNAETIIRAIYGDYKYFRPSSAYIFRHISSLLTPDKFLLKFVPVMKILGLIIDNPPIFYPYKKYYPVFNNYPYRRKLYELAQDYKPIITRGNTVIATLKNIINFSDNILGSKRTYNIGDTIKSCNLSQNIHIAKFNLANCIANGYKFYSECCGVGVNQYLSENKYSGVAINGVFFDLLRSNYPLGPYSDKNITEFHERIKIPRIYENYYGYISSNGENISFGTYNELLAFDVDDIRQQQIMAVCGPVLIDRQNGNNYEFSEEELNTKITIKNKRGVNEELLIFNCANPQPIEEYKEDEGNPNNPNNHKYFDKSEKPNIPYCDNGTYREIHSAVSLANCTKINSGELSHGANLNPRSCMAYNSNTNILYFIMIEGRGAKGSGMDFVKMVYMLNKLDPGITFALNLDGGGSSDIAFRNENSDTITSVNPAHNLGPYPTGNLFCILKK